MKRAPLVLVAWLLLAVMFGCSEDPQVSRVGDRPLDLRGYDCISLKSVEVDQNLGFPGLPAQLTPAIQGELVQSERWAYRGPAPSVMVVSGHHIESRRPVESTTIVQPAASAPSAGPQNCRSLALSVRITDLQIPTKMERGFGKPRTMKCRIEVFDESTGANLGGKEVVARSGLTSGQRLGAQILVGPGGVPPPQDEETEKSAALTAMAKAIVKALDAAKAAGAR